MHTCNSEYAANRLKQINTRIEEAAKQAGRASSDIDLIGAAKQQSVELVESFIDAGLRHIGENYLQEGVDKKNSIEKIRSSNEIDPALPSEQTKTKATWHYIGRIQSNKAKAIAEYFDWVHSIDRFKIAQKLAQTRLQLPENSPASQCPLNVLIQVDVDSEQSKAGTSPAEAIQLSDQISQLDGITLRGFMLLPLAGRNPLEQRKPFAQAQSLLQQTNQRYGLNLDTLSMGMSSDLEAAILEGSTMVRVGSDLFGKRAK